VIQITEEAKELKTIKKLLILMALNGRATSEEIDKGHWRGPWKY